MQDAFTVLYRTGKARSGMRDKDVAAALGLSAPSLTRRKKNPALFSLGEVLKLSVLFYWDGEEIMQIIGLYAKGGE